MYTGELPFRDIPDGEVASKILEGKLPERPHFHGGLEMENDLWSILNRCWSRNPYQRYTARNLISQLPYACRLSRPQDLVALGNTGTLSRDNSMKTANHMGRFQRAISWFQGWIRYLYA
ncbi:hypothetical protein C8Q75DRAFT_763291 [Abortiporus biennis]|nr:hypothetical protein C8Q75DRAFT_763291 [Abortiporus biennis]